MRKTILLLIAAVFSLTCHASQDNEVTREAIKKHDRAVYIKDGWMRDPYIILGPDNMYYLTGTTPNPGDPREKTDKYNTGLGDKSIVGSVMQLWRSPDLVEWTYLGTPYTLDDSAQYKDEMGDKREIKKVELLWAPELHWTGEKWALVHCPQEISNLVLSEGMEVKDPWTNPSPKDFDKKHDPSLFKDDDGTWYLLWGNTMIAPINKDFKGLADKGKRIDPSNRKIGHEGATLRKIGKKYVHFGTAWSTDKPRKGSYNLYYCTSDNILGPYGKRQFAGRFLGHGTPFQDKEGRWWCTAFYNGNIPPIDSEGIETRDLSETAQSINEQGVTIVPLEVKVLDDGEIYIRANDKRYGTPGPDEVQQF